MTSPSQNPAPEPEPGRASFPPTALTGTRPPAELSKLHGWFSTEPSRWHRALHNHGEHFPNHGTDPLLILVVSSALTIIASATLGMAISRGYSPALAWVLLGFLFVGACTVHLGAYRQIKRRFAQSEVDLQRRLVAAREEAEAEATNSARAARGLLTAADLMVRNEELVRQQIVSDLHDHVAQPLVAAAFARQDPTRSRDDIADLAAIAEGEMREVMLSRRPLSLQTTLAEAVARAIDALEVRWDLRVEVTWAPGDLELPHPIAVTLYRFAHECLHNVAKHAKVSTATLEFTHSEDSCAMVITDDGAGFEPDEVAGDSLGLDLLRRRAQLVGGRVRFLSAPGEGTAVSLLVPLTRRGAAPPAPCGPASPFYAEE